MLRELALLARAPRVNTEPAQLLEPVSQTLRAWPWLCDRLGHLNNARYFDLMSYARAYWLSQNALLRPVVRQRLAFVIAGVSGVFRRSIPHMARFQLDTRIAAFDERWLCLEHTFCLLSGEARVAARFLAKGQLRSSTGALAPSEALRRCGREPPEPASAPPDLAAWEAAQAACLGVVHRMDEIERASLR